jgi:membrane protease YdiL (CAAX protease family)
MTYAGGYRYPQYAPAHVPGAGWYPDPEGMTQLRWWTGQQWSGYVAPYPTPPRAPLDEAVAAMKAADPRPWGARPVAMPLGAYVAVIVAGLIASIFAPSHGGGLTAFAVVANVVIEVALSVAVYLAGRDVARRYGGWGRAFGWRRPRARDLKYALAGIGITFALRFAVAIAVTAIAGPDATKQAQNLHVQRASVTTAILLIVLTVIMAPLVEELVFRGLILRTFMRRLSFWPAAVASTTIFALGHTYEVGTLVGAITLALMVGTLGITNCWLNRRTDSLVPGMIVHAAFNLLATVVLLTSLSS